MASKPKTRGLLYILGGLLFLPILLRLWMIAILALYGWTRSMVLGMTVPFLLMTLLLILQGRRESPFRITGKRQPKPERSRSLVILQEDTNFLERTDRLFSMLLPIQISFTAPVIARMVLEPSYVAVLQVLLVYGSVLVPYSLHYYAVATDSIIRRLDAWISLVAILSIDLTYFLFCAVWLRFLFPVLVPSVMGRMDFDIVFGVIDVMVPLFVSIGFSKWIRDYYHVSLSLRKKEVPKSINAFKIVILSCQLVFAYISSIAYMATFYGL